MIADVETPVSAALKLIEPGRGDWVLESVESGETRGRYSLIGLDPDLIFDVTGDTARINRDWRHDREAFRPVEAGALQRYAIWSPNVASTFPKHCRRRLRRSSASSLMKRSASSSGSRAPRGRV